ncbi:hypothetical protein F5Y19DRAFT_429323 [Xylariaceae sp. FL1651]|nr:hypothetical protein F5Y19DRAFT_429323 [Xylariaceae sp. FL1651]
MGGTDIAPEASRRGLVMDSNDGDFEFVAQRFNGTLSKVDRYRVRSHVMRAVGAARRKTGDVTSATPIPPPSLSLSGVEVSVRSIGLDPMDLSALSSITLGPVVSTILQSEPNRLKQILLCRQPSYFSFIAPRFGHFPALDNAFRCLVTVAHSKLVPNRKRSDSVILGYYGKALRSLQAAVDDPIDRYAAETLCAASILAVFELFNLRSEQLWGSHMAGVSRLIQLRGPARFGSEFEQALLLKLAYPILMHSMFCNIECVLDTPAWAKVFTDAIDPLETFTDRSPLGISIMLAGIKIPGLRKRCIHAVSIRAADDELDALAAEMHSLRSYIITWRRDFNMALMRALDVEKYTYTKNQNRCLDKRYDLLGIYSIVYITLSRLLICITSNGRALIEDEVQGQALELKQLYQSVREGTKGSSYDPINYRTEFVLSQQVLAANRAIATHADFRSAVGSGRIIDPNIMMKYFTILGKKK